MIVMSGSSDYVNDQNCLFHQMSFLFLHLSKRVQLSEFLGYCNCRVRTVDLCLPPAEMSQVSKHTGPYLPKQQDRVFSGKRTRPATHFCYIWDVEETVSSPSWLALLG